jgi:hypothetical protein
VAQQCRRIEFFGAVAVGTDAELGALELGGIDRQLPVIDDRQLLGGYAAGV